MLKATRETIGLSILQLLSSRLKPALPPKEFVQETFDTLLPTITYGIGTTRLACSESELAYTNFSSEFDKLEKTPVYECILNYIQTILRMEAHRKVLKYRAMKDKETSDLISGTQFAESLADTALHSRNDLNLHIRQLVLFTTLHQKNNYTLGHMGIFFQWVDTSLSCKNYQASIFESKDPGYFIFHIREFYKYVLLSRIYNLETFCSIADQLFPSDEDKLGADVNAFFCIDIMARILSVPDPELSARESFATMYAFAVSAVHRMLNLVYSFAPAVRNHYTDVFNRSSFPPKTRMSEVLFNKVHILTDTSNHLPIFIESHIRECLKEKKTSVSYLQKETPEMLGEFKPFIFEDCVSEFASPGISFQGQGTRLWGYDALTKYARLKNDNVLRNFPEILGVITLMHPAKPALPFFIKHASPLTLDICFPADKNTTNFILDSYGVKKNDYLIQYPVEIDAVLSLSTEIGQGLLSQCLTHTIGSKGSAPSHWVIDTYPHVLTFAASRMESIYSILDTEPAAGQNVNHPSNMFYVISASINVSSTYLGSILKNTYMFPNLYKEDE
jgi:hypothetical protein